MDGNIIMYKWLMAGSRDLVWVLECLAPISERVNYGYRVDLEKATTH